MHADAEEGERRNDCNLDQHHDQKRDVRSLVADAEQRDQYDEINEFVREAERERPALISLIQLRQPITRRLGQKLVRPRAEDDSRERSK